MNMLKLYKITVVLALLAIAHVSMAQTAPALADPQVANTSDYYLSNTRQKWSKSLVPDGAYDRVPHANAPLTWQPIREVDVMWQRRVWREIDTREKQNIVFRYPGDDYTGGGMFIEILIDAVRKGKVKAYADERFTVAKTKDEVNEMLAGKIDSTPVIDPTTGIETIVTSRRDFDPETITKFRMKEDWMFDRNLGRMVVRITGLAAYQDKKDDAGNYLFSIPMFWLYYRELREVLAQYEVYNPENEVARMTWDDYFEGRFFSSKIIKVSNATDAGSFKELGFNPMESLYEGQREAEKVFNKEHDMWVY